MNRQQLSEICFGLILTDRHPVTLYKPSWFSTPYDSGVELLMQKGATREDVSKVISSAYIQDASTAVHKFNGIGEYKNFDWAKALRVSYNNEERGRKLQKMGKKLQENEEVDLLPLYAEIGSSISEETSGLSLLGEIDYNTYKPFQLTGYEPLDKVLGGIPTDGPIVIFGSSGVGKSKFVSMLIAKLLKTYPDKYGAIYTLEMNEKHWAWRSAELFPEILDVKDRLYVSGSVKDIEELVAEISVKKVDYVVLDDIDNCVKSNDAGEYERVFRRIKEVCRFMAIPFFVIAQINRAAETEIAYGSKEKGTRFLRKTDLAWTSAAEKSAALLLGLQVVTCGLDMEAEDYPTVEDEGTDYLIAFKSRDGWLGDRDPRYQVGPGAIVLNHTSNWSGKPYAGKWKLWTRSNKVNKMNRSKREE